MSVSVHTVWDGSFIEVRNYTHYDTDGLLAAARKVNLDRVLIMHMEQNKKGTVVKREHHYTNRLEIRYHDERVIEGPGHFTTVERLTKRAIGSGSGVTQAISDKLARISRYLTESVARTTVRVRIPSPEQVLQLSCAGMSPAEKLVLATDAEVNRQARTTALACPAFQAVLQLHVAMCLWGHSAHGEYVDTRSNEVHKRPGVEDLRPVGEVRLGNVPFRLDADLKREDNKKKLKRMHERAKELAQSIAKSQKEVETWTAELKTLLERTIQFEQKLQEGR